jgi:hypothetical protein
MKNVIEIFSKTLTKLAPLAEHYGTSPEVVPNGFAITVAHEDITQGRDGNVTITDRINGRAYVCEGSTLREARAERIQAMLYSAEKATLARQ